VDARCRSTLRLVDVPASVRPVPRAAGGWITFVRVDELVAISFTADRADRPGGDLLAAVPGTRATVEALHRRFAGLAEGDGWFRAEADLLTFVDTVHSATRRTPEQAAALERRQAIGEAEGRRRVAIIAGRRS
jgi:hypothetical protein